MTFLHKWIKNCFCVLIYKFPLLHFRFFLQVSKCQNYIPAYSTRINLSCRIDNMIYHLTKPEAIGVLDWELSTIGDPITDLVTCCLGYYTPAELPAIPCKYLTKNGLHHFFLGGVDVVNQQICVIMMLSLNLPFLKLNRTPVGNF